MIRHVVMWKFQEGTREAMLDFLESWRGCGSRSPRSWTWKWAWTAVQRPL